jgi:hypothetical protein
MRRRATVGCCGDLQPAGKAGERGREPQQQEGECDQEEERNLPQPQRRLDAKGVSDRFDQQEDGQRCERDRRPAARSATASGPDHGDQRQQRERHHGRVLHQPQQLGHGERQC